VPASVGAQPAVPSVQHFMMGLSVGDMDKMTSWYGEMLGFKVTADVPMGQGGGKVRFIESGNERIELVYSPTSKPGPERKMPGHADIRGWVQLAMEVPDLDAAKAALAAKGVKPELDITPIPPLGIRIMFLRDPEGNMVELMQRLKK
jgi:catechol 2,3-dioxygenase-like lactoylglutathione lyase family enzyme